MSLFYINFLFYEHRRTNIILCILYNRILIVVPLYVLSFSQIVLIYFFFVSEDINIYYFCSNLLTIFFHSRRNKEEDNSLLSNLIVKY